MKKHTFVLASANKNKIREFRQILCDRASEIFGDDTVDIELLSLSDIGFFEDIVEDGETFEENAAIKAVCVSKCTEYPCIADDSGLCVDALGGAPGVYSARYAGEHGDDEANIKKLLSELDGEENRSAQFVSAIAYAVAGELSFTVRGEAHGNILCEKAGEGGFGYDPVFECAHHKISYAEMSAELKNSVSHRRKAIERLADELFKKN